MKTYNLTMFVIFSTLFGGCGANHFTAMSNQHSVNIQPTANANIFVKSKVNAESVETNTAVADDEDGNEITECSPQKVYRGETFKVSFKKSHGKRLAIYSEKTREFYFLTENAPYYFPQIPPDAFEKLTDIEFDTQKVRNDSEELDSEGNSKSKQYFARTGWYRVIVGHQALDVDFIDMPVTGSCRVYYINKKRPPEK